MFVKYQIRSVDNSKEAYHIFSQYLSKATTKATGSFDLQNAAVQTTNQYKGKGIASVKHKCNKYDEKARETVMLKNSLIIDLDHLGLYLSTCPENKYQRIRTADPNDAHNHYTLWENQAKWIGIM